MDTITTVIDYPVNINIVSTPAPTVTINAGGVPGVSGQQGPQGLPGTGQFDSTSVVYNSGYQLITGLKNFSSGISVSYISGDSNYKGVIDTNGIVSIDWTGRTLVSNNGNNSIDWGNYIINDSTNSNSILYGARVMIDGNNKYSIEWNNRLLRDNNQIVTIDWKNKILSGTWTQNGNSILDSSLPIITGISIIGSAQHLTGYVTFSSATNDISVGQNSSGIIISAPGIGQTGSLLYNLITGLSGQIIKYTTFLTSGVETEFITYPVILTSRPTTLNFSMENDRDSIIYNVSSSGITSSGFYANYSDFLSNSGYKLDINILV